MSLFNSTPNVNFPVPLPAFTNEDREEGRQLPVMPTLSSDLASSAFGVRNTHGVIPLSLPSEGEWDTLPALIAAAQEHAKLAGYAVVEGPQGQKKKEKGGRWTKFLICSHGGKHDDRGLLDEYRKRPNRQSRKAGCPMKMKIQERPGGTWTLKRMDGSTARPPKDYCSHNHGPNDVKAYPEHRQLSEEQLHVVKAGRAAGIPPNRIKASLKAADPNCEVKTRDIYNKTAQVVRELKQGLQQNEAFIANLTKLKEEGKMFFEYTLTEEGRIENVFIADMRSIQYLNENPYILIIDCTYKTNKFGMPLLDILGVDGLDQGFTVGVSFMNAETEEGYGWAITHLRSLFQPGILPSVIATDCDEGLMHAVESSFPAAHTKMVLCYWHVSKNVVANCKKFFETEEAWEPFLKGFKDCVFAKTEEEFEDIVKEWQSDFYWNDGMPWQVGVNSTPQEVQEMVEKEMAQSALTYCLGRWLGTYKTQLVHCYVDQHFHAGTTTTSRLEGAHHVLKSWIGGPSKNLTAVWEAVQLAIDHQLDEIQAKRAYNRASSLLRTGNEFFAPLQRRITSTAQVKVAEQWHIAQTEEARVRNGDASTICTGNYSRSMGIPCWHTIKARLEEGGRLQPQDFHPHWHWEKPLPGSAPVVLPPPVLDPETRQRRRTQEAERRLQARQHARVKTARTGRILSQFEQQQPILRHCSACIEYGHDKATCRGCRSTTHTRNACPNVSYQRRIAADSQLNIEGGTSFQQQPQQPPMTNLTPSSLHPFVPAPIPLGMQFPPNPGPSQVPTSLPPIYTAYPPPTQTQLPPSHAWNGPHNPHYWQ